LRSESVRIILKEDRSNLRGCTLITGFHGVGMVGYITTKHLVSELKATRIGFIDTGNLPPYVCMHEDRLQTPFEIYRYDNIVLILTEMPLNSKDFHAFSREVAKWSIEVGMEKAILVGGLDARTRKNPEEKLRCVATEQYIRKYGCDLNFLERNYYVIGPLALMLSYYEMNDFPAIAVLSYSSVVNGPDPRAAAAAVEYISKKLNINVDTKLLLEEAEKLEKELMEISMKQIKAQKAEEASGTFYV